jgi:hypothetical protein
MDKYGRYFLMMGRLSYFEEKKSAPHTRKAEQVQEVARGAYLFLFNDLVLIAVCPVLMGTIVVHY